MNLNIFKKSKDYTAEDMIEMARETASLVFYALESKFETKGMGKWINASTYRRIKRGFK